MSDGSVVLGVDSSTQSTKVVARRIADGEVLGEGRAPHPVTDPPVSEQDPRAWWAALEDACRQLGAARSEVVAVAVAAQQHGLVLLDASGEPARAAPLWNDTTAADAAAELVSTLGAEAWAAGCGSVPVASFTVSKLAHLFANEAEVVAAVDRVMLPHDYLTWRLCGRHVTDRGEASGTGWFDPSTDRYRADLLGAAVDDAEAWLARLPSVLAPFEAAGELTEGAAEALGLAKGVIVSAGTGDNMGAALGLGLRPGDVALSLGTSGTVYAVSETATADPSGAVAGFADATGRWLPLVCTLNATKVTDAVARWLGTDAAGLAELALGAGDGPIEPQMVPYLDGERTPNLPDASGSLLGLRTTTTREQLARAAHDGVLQGLFDGIDRLRQAGVTADGDLHLVGGGAASPAYRRRAAALHGEQIRVPLSGEVVAAGAAVQAACVVTDTTPDEIAERWDLRAATVVDPPSN